MKRRNAVLVMLAMLPWAGVNAQQHSATTIFRVTAKVNADCEITAPDLAVGTYPAQGGTPLLRATCSPNSTYNISLNRGNSPGATVTPQLITAASQVANGQVIGTGTGLTMNHTLFGSVPASQVIPEANYANTITVLIYY